MRESFDVVILGCGEAGIFAAYELEKLNPGLKLLAIDQGPDIYHRSCPIVSGKVRECIHCPICHTMCGFGGAGAFSDGKFNFTTAFGGWLTDFIDPATVMELIEYVDAINVAHGATEEVYSTETAEAKALSRRALGYDLHLLQARCKHLGTEKNLMILQNIYEDLKNKLEFRFNTSATTIAQADGGYLVTLKNGDELFCKYLLAAPGRSGAEWFSDVCKGLGLHLLNNQVDVGVRVELPATVFEHITNVVYESKLIYRTKQYGDQVRTFCMNPYGHVVAENVEGINTVNGHSYADPALRSENTNFALLVSNRFTQPFNEPYRYGKHIASLSNLLAGGVLVQRFGGGATSKLFTNVREKMSLCYYASASFEKFKGVLSVSSGVEFSKLETAKTEILRQLEACKAGDITDDELESARGYLVSDLKIAMDSPGRLDDYYMGQILLEQDGTMEDLASAIARVTKQEAADAIQALRLDTIYALEGVTA